MVVITQPLFLSHSESLLGQTNLLPSAFSFSHFQHEKIA